MGRTTLITTVALAAALVAPGAAGAATYEQLHSQNDKAVASDGPSYTDLRSPDARDAALASEESSYTDLRSPDARDAALASEEPSYTDLRSPDARDAGRTPVPAPEPVVEIREAPPSGFDWGDAGIGAAGILALVSIATGLMLLVGGRRRRRAVQVPAH
jgi:hypothetical protein